LNKLKDVVGKQSVVFLNFKSLPVKETTEMRDKLREAGISYYVAKKTLVKKAFGESKVEGDLPALSGELAVAYADDLTSPAREIFTFQKKLDGKISIIGGVFENKYLSKAEMEEIAKIPGLFALQGMFVNVINSPIQGFVLSLQAIADKKAATA